MDGWFVDRLLEASPRQVRFAMCYNRALAISVGGNSVLEVSDRRLTPASESFAVCFRCFTDQGSSNEDCGI